MSVPIPAAVAACLVAVVLSGCLGGESGQCRPLTGAGTGDRQVSLLTKPAIQQDAEAAWEILVQCTGDGGPLDTYTFAMVTPDLLNLTVAPEAGWTDGLTYYAGTNVTGPQPGSGERTRVEAQQERPDRGDYPVFRFRFIDSDDDGVLGEADEIHVAYDAGSTTLEAFDSDFPAGRYWFTVHDRTSDELIGQVLATFEGAHGDGRVHQ